MPEVTELESKIVDMVMQGIEKTKIAKNLGVSRSWLYKILNKSEVIAELESRRKQLRKTACDKITNNVNHLVDNMLEMANNSSDNRVRFNANKYLLDRVLGTPVSAYKEDIVDNDANKEKDANTLKKEIDDIKKLRVAK